MKETFTAHYRSEIGLIRVTGRDDGITAVDFVEGEARTDARIPGCLEECIGQLDEYFRGKRTTFAIPLKPQGTPFQQKVWAALAGIPFGKTVSYRDVASAVGHAKAFRAVGGANHRNPIAVIIPCHRVIGADGKLTGYGGGLWRKEWLLAHERDVLAAGRQGRSAPGV
jgi:methylated-DNA-[protein]-cysteine S-methyltransferase